MIGIIGAMEAEVSLLRSALQNTAVIKIGNFEFYSGKLGTSTELQGSVEPSVRGSPLEAQPVVLLLCGIGKVNAAVGCALLIDHFKPELVLNTGSAGGIDPILKFGDVIVSSGLVYHDVDVTAFNYAPGQIPGQPAVFPVSEELMRRAETAINQLKTEKILPADFNHVRGIIGSGDVFMHIPEKIAAVRKTFPEMRAVEMEGAAITHACALFKVPSLIIRAVSDIAGTESPMTHDEFLPIASKHSAEIVRRIVKNFQ